jgi:cytochrome P450
VAIASVPVFDTSRAGIQCPFSPPPALEQVAASGPLARVKLWDGSEPWLVSGYSEMRSLMTDPRISSDDFREGYPPLSPGSKIRKSEARSIINMDEPDHSRVRRLVTGLFTAKQIEELRPKVTSLVHELIDGLISRGNTADLISDFALVIPTRVICGIMNVPYEDHAFFQEKAELLVDSSRPAEEETQAQQALFDYIDAMLLERMDAPRDDLFGRLVEHIHSGRVTRNELATMGLLLLTGGFETTANMMGLSTLALLQNPDQLALLRAADDPAFIATAVEEMLRYLSISQTSVRRVATADIPIGNVIVRKGDGLIFALHLANRDPLLCQHADSIDLSRGNRHHVAFGYGVHQCVGQPLARMELQVVYGTLFQRIPTMELAVDPSELRYKTEAIVSGIRELPVKWAP